jgi:RNA recognition motif-containing protein
MGKRLFVGNLSSETTVATLTTAFAQDGRKVERIDIVMDRDSGKPRGFAFVEMSSDGDAAGAITALHGAEIGGKPMRVSAAEARRSPFGGPLGGKHTQKAPSTSHRQEQP